MVVRDVNGDVADAPIARRLTRRGAERAMESYLRYGRKLYGNSSGIPEPIPGRPMYSVAVEREP